MVKARHRPGTDILSVRIARDIKEAATRAAADDHRSLTSFVEKVLADALSERSYLAKPKPKIAGQEETGR
jgi:hypothetical protein